MPGPIDWDGLVIGPCFDVFAQPVTYRPLTGAPFAITGVFDREYLGVTILDSDVASSTRKPILGVQLSQFTAAGAAGPKQNDKVQIVNRPETFVFLVRNVQPDGHGHAVLELNIVSKTP
jgi:hypothetical protein